MDFNDVVLVRSVFSYEDVLYVNNRLYSTPVEDELAEKLADLSPMHFVVRELFKDYQCYVDNGYSWPKNLADLVNYGGE